VPLARPDRRAGHRLDAATRGGLARPDCSTPRRRA